MVSSKKSGVHMDLSLVQSSLIFLAPYLQKGLEGLAGKLGERAVDFLGKLKNLVSHDQASSEVVANFEKDPELYVTSLEVMLKRKLAADSGFARQLTELVAETGPASEIMVQATGGDSAVGIMEADQVKGSLKVDVKTEDTGQTIGIKTFRQGAG
jgi:hypothetical protein